MSLAPLLTRLGTVPTTLPILPLLLAGYIVGSTAALIVKPAALPPLWCVLALLTLIPVVFRWPRAGLQLMPFIFLALGWQHTALHLAGPSAPRHVARLIPPGQDVTLAGTIPSMAEYDGTHTRFVLECDAVMDRTGPPRPEGGSFLATHGPVRLTLAGPPPPSLVPGQRLMIMTRLDSPQGYRTPGAFDIELHLAAQGIFRIGYLDSVEKLLKLPPKGRSLTPHLRHGPERLRHAIARFMQERLPRDIAALYQGLVIGSRAAIPADVIEDFKASGCMHILAISGMHLSLLGIMLGWSLTWLMQRSERLMLRLHVRSLAAALTMPLLMSYTLLAGGQMPVLRALVMSLLVTAALLLRRQHDLFNLLCAAALALLLWQPLALAGASFQLSCAAVLAIILIQPRLLTLWNQQSFTGENDPQPPSLLLKILRKLTAALLVSLAATLGTLPIMLWHFNQFSPAGPLANLLVEPLLCLWALPLGLLAILLQAPLPEAAAAMLQLGALGVEASMAICHHTAALPLARLYSVTPSPWEISSYYAMLAIILWWRPLGNKAAPLLLVALIALVLPASVYWLRNRFDSGLTVWYLDVGQGSASVLELPGGKTVLVDGGGSGVGASVGERVIAPFLWRRRHVRLDDVVLTHPDSDHTNGIDYILRHFRPRHLWINGLPGREDSYQRLLEAARRQGVAVLTPDAETVLTATPEARLTVLDNPVRRRALASDAPHQTPSNEGGLILKLQTGQHAMLFPGDIGAATEQQAIEANSDLKASVLLAAHHGSKGSNSAGLLQAVQPTSIVVSAGRRKRGQFPAAEHEARWEAAGIRTFVTGRDGAIRCRINGTNLTLTPWKTIREAPRQ